MHRDPNGARLVRNSTRDCLADPPGSISTEFIAFPVIKFLYRFQKAKIPFLNQIQELHSLSDVTLCNADDQPQIRLIQSVLCSLVAVFDPDRKLDLFFRGQQRHFSNFLQVHPHMVLQADALRQRFQVLHVLLARFFRHAVKIPHDINSNAFRDLIYLVDDIGFQIRLVQYRIDLVKG